MPLFPGLEYDCCNLLMQQIVLPLVFTETRDPIFHFKSNSMKWNAIISKSQYEKALQRASEINRGLPEPGEKDELLLLTIMIKDYEQRHGDIFAEETRNLKTQADRAVYCKV